VMQSSSRAAVEAVSQRLQCTYSCESSAYAWKCQGRDPNIFGAH